MTVERIQTFRNARSRLRLDRDGRWREAWTRHLGMGEARLSLWSFEAVAAGERALVECGGDGVVARFAAVALGQSGQDVALRVAGPLSLETSGEAIRIEAAGLEGTLRTDEGEFGLLVTDVSPEGVGGLTAAFPELRSTHGLALRGGSGEAVECRARVASSRLDPREAGRCRVGLRIVDASRLDAVRWARIVEAMARR